MMKQSIPQSNGQGGRAVARPYIRGRSTLRPYGGLIETIGRTRKVASLVAIVILALLVMPGGVTLGQGNRTTTLLASGRADRKFDLVIIGDGFRAGADQTTFNNFVQNVIMDSAFMEGPIWESKNAFNIYRVNVNSVDSGVTQVNNMGNVTTARNTALDWRFSGMWNRCWMEPGPNTTANFNAIMAAENNLPADLIIYVLNQAGGGGCRRDNSLAVNVGEVWTTVAHELGHMVGGLCDEYQTGTQIAYTGTEPGCANMTINTNRQTIKWGQFIDPNIALPTTFNGTTMNAANTVGAFVGGTLNLPGGGNQSYNAGLWRPTFNSRMNSNTPEFGPVAYTRMKEAMRVNEDFTFLKSYVGDFTGDGSADVVIHNANSLALFRSTGSGLEPIWIATGAIPVWDTFTVNDQFYVGDFDGDGKDDLFVFNALDWVMPYFGLLRSTGSGFEMVQRFDRELPGWGDMRRGDQFYVADYNGDHRDDILVLNTTDWAVGYLLLLRSNGFNLQYTRRYDDTLPGWDRMLRGDKLYVADINADGRDEFYIFNGTDWNQGYLQLFRSTGSGFDYVRRYDNLLPGWDEMRRNDQFYVADFDGDGREDLYVFNGPDWNIAYLGKLQSNGTALDMISRFDGFVPGWDALMPNDQFYVADIDGDGRRDDLFGYNATDWATEYLGELLSTTPASLTGWWQEDWVGDWNLGRADRFLVGNFNINRGFSRVVAGIDSTVVSLSRAQAGFNLLSFNRDDLFILNAEWFGLLQSLSHSVRQVAIYPKWIHTVPYHADGWWGG
jgi:hypothetical protein